MSAAVQPVDRGDSSGNILRTKNQPKSVGDVVHLCNYILRLQMSVCHYI